MKSHFQGIAETSPDARQCGIYRMDVMAERYALRRSGNEANQPQVVFAESRIGDGALAVDEVAEEDEGMIEQFRMILATTAFCWNPNWN